MSQAARNDERAKRIIAFLYGENVEPENITRLLNYHFEETFSCTKNGSTHKSVIRRVPDGNYAPPIEIWTQP